MPLVKIKVTKTMAGRMGETSVSTEEMFVDLEQFKENYPDAVFEVLEEE
jgi:hypothetical protein